MKLEEVLIEIDKIITTHKSGEWLSIDKLVLLNRDLSFYNYLITKVNIESYDDWNKLIYNRDVSESVAAAKVRADVKHPELRITRKIMEAIEKTMFTMQQELSILKKENK
jgi:hypothetical protein